MKNKEEASVLNDLLHITNDRIEGFAKIEGKVWENYPDVKPEYAKLNSLARIMKNELIDLIQEDGEEADDTPSVAGALHRTWIDIKNSFTIGNREESTIGNVIFGEKAAAEAYQNAIDSGKLSQRSLDIVSEHLKHIKDSYHQFSRMSEYKNE
ncbi:PA2169 family four-helix-bundle protein [Chryseobacterium cheonjiense]|uniref:PA2169 family four-helix-bundle protein n=1 Tax=Chryseobacterium cheonjiense TaxID=2728845 RepID=A0A7Y0FIE2_9FLAO|nr:PA2169 family four-helix-bundle protein [Chryseobacterium cheonjiense]NML57281.1 PA2169 family four-helix-bundle protein [Chryseobacterium cheonjiense]